MHATFTLTEDPCADRRVVTVDSVPEALAELTAALRTLATGQRGV